MRILLTALVLFPFMLSAQKAKNQGAEVKIGRVMLERDRKEMDEFYSLLFQIRRNPETDTSSIVTVMKREISQMQRKLGTARIEIGRSRVKISNALEAGKRTQNAGRTRMEIKRDIRHLKDDQRDVKKLEKSYKNIVHLLDEFSKQEDKDKAIQFLERFAKIMESDIRWTLSEIQEGSRTGG